MRAENLVIRRGAATLLRDVSATIAHGHVTAIVGPNGAGKSTLLRALAGVWPVSGGAVYVGEQPLAGMARGEAAKRVSYLPQDGRIEGGFTVAEVVWMGRYAHGGTGSTAVAAAMARVDVAHLAKRFGNELSGGERQRVLLARSLATEARAMLLDEPTANLDIDHSLEVWELCRNLAAEGRAVAVATHDLNAAVRYAGAVIVLKDGRVEPGELDGAMMARVFRVRAEQDRTGFTFYRNQ